jgi:hypothetical protein
MGYFYGFTPYGLMLEALEVDSPEAEETAKDFE